MISLTPAVSNHVALGLGLADRDRPDWALLRRIGALPAMRCSKPDCPVAHFVGDVIQKALCYCKYESPVCREEPRSWPTVQSQFQFQSPEPFNSVALPRKTSWVSNSSQTRTVLLPRWVPIAGSAGSSWPLRSLFGGIGGAAEPSQFRQWCFSLFCLWGLPWVSGVTFSGVRACFWF